MIYFDHNATTPIDERVLDAMLPFLKSFYGNPSSLYRQGRIARTAIDRARDQIAALVNASASQVIFTSGGTEANNLALTALAPKGKLAITSIEHPSILEPASRLKNSGNYLQVIEVDSNGLIKPEAVDSLIHFQPDLVSIMLANNETGVIQDVTGVGALVKTENTVMHTDAIQALGKIPVDFDQLGVQLMTLSSHKIYGPKGCGALIADKSVSLKPLILGGRQEQALRAGTENVAAIVGFGKAAELAQIELAQRNEKILQLRNLLEKGLTSIPRLIIFSHYVERLPNTVQFGIPDIDGEMLLMKLDHKKGIAVSSGSSCASGGNKASSVLNAMGIEENLAKSAIRISMGQSNTEAEIDEFINVLKSQICPG